MSKKNETSLSIWESENQLSEIKQFVADGKLNELEFNMLCQIGKATNLNPFLREIWAVKYGNQAANIFIGRDGYRKAAQEHPEYDSHTAEAVYSNDEFVINDGIVSHKMGIVDRGNLVGAYCTVKRKSSSRANYVFVRFDEYYQGNKNKDGSIKTRYDKFKKEHVNMGETLWDTKPETMIKKVAEAQGLRATFQNLFAGTYDSSEAWEAEVVAKESMTKTPSETLSAIDNLWAEFYKLICQNAPEKYDGSPENSDYIKALTCEKTVGIQDHRYLSSAQANTFLEGIQKGIQDQLNILAQKAMEMSEAAAARAAERQAADDSAAESEEVPF